MTETEVFLFILLITVGAPEFRLKLNPLVIDFK